MCSLGCGHAVIYSSCKSRFCIHSLLIYIYIYCGTVHVVHLVIQLSLSKTNTARFLKLTEARGWVVSAAVWSTLIAKLIALLWPLSLTTLGIQLETTSDLSTPNYTILRTSSAWIINNCSDTMLLYLHNQLLQGLIHSNTWPFLSGHTLRTHKLRTTAFILPGFVQFTGMPSVYVKYS